MAYYLPWIQTSSHHYLNPQNHLTLGNSPPRGLSFFFAIKARFSSFVWGWMQETSTILYCCYFVNKIVDFGGPFCVMRWILASIEVILLNFWIVSSFLLKIAIRSSLEGHPKAHRAGIYCCNFIIGILISRYRRVVVHT